MPAAELDATVAQYVQEILAAGPEAIAAAKALIAERLGARRSTTRRRSPPRAIATRRVSPEGQEGLRAFLEKRKPAGHGDAEHDDEVR